MAEAQAVPAAHKSKKTRSPAYPILALSKAIERAKTFYTAERRHAVPFAVAVQHWAFQPKSSGAFQTVATMKQYGLMQDVGGGKDRRVQLTDLALRILLDQREGSEEREQAVKAAALKPTIHADMWKKWGVDLPSDATIRTYLVMDKKFTEDSADGVIKTYKDTIRVANLAETDTVSGDEGDTEDTESPEDRQVETYTQDTAPPRVKAPTTPPAPQAVPGETERLRVPLKGGRAVRLLFSGSLPTQSDISKLIALLELSKDSFPKSDEDSAAEQQQ